MGYKPESKRYKLEFEDYPGLDIWVQSASLGKLLDIQKTMVVGQKLIESNPENQLKIFGFFAKRIVTWNVEHPALDEGDELCPQCGLAEGDPMTTTAESLFCLDITFIMKLITGWMTTVASVSLPKEMNSKNGENDILSDLMSQLGRMQNPQTLPTPN